MRQLQTLKDIPIKDIITFNSYKIKCIGEKDYEYRQSLLEINSRYFLLDKPFYTSECVGFSMVIYDLTEEITTNNIEFFEEDGSYYCDREGIELSKKEVASILMKD